MNEEKHKLDDSYEAVGLPFARGYRIQHKVDPTITNHLLRGHYGSLQQAKDHFRLWKMGAFYRRDPLGKFQSKKESKIR